VDEGMPPDPFAGNFPQGLDDLAPELQAVMRELDAAGHDLRALLAQESFRSLFRAVGALTEDRARAVLIRALVQIRLATDAAWNDWMTRP